MHAFNTAEYTIKICTNEKNFPKRYRWCITNKIVEEVLEMNALLQRANAIYFTSDPKFEEDYKMRHKYQTKALGLTYSLLSYVDLAYRTFGIDANRVSHWADMITHEQVLIRKWKKADEQRFYMGNG